MSIRHNSTQTQLALTKDGETITIQAARVGEEDTKYILAAFADGKAVYLNPTLEELCKLRQQLDTIIDRS